MKPRTKTRSKVILAYHGSTVPIRRFDRRFSAQGVFWFSEDKNRIIRGESGAVGTDFLMTCELTVKNTAGWNEYENMYLDQLEKAGFDSIHLDDDWIIFDAKNIRVIAIDKVR